MDKPTTNAVRQVLMNELGLTRDSIRQEVTEIVTTEVAKAMTRLVDDGFLEKIVIAEFNKLASL